MKTLACAATAVVVSLLLAPAEGAAQATFTGAGSGAFSAEAAFLAAIGTYGVYTTEGFETYASQTVTVPISYPGGTGTLDGDANIYGVATSSEFTYGGGPVRGDRGYRDYTGTSMWIDFTAPVSAFGFFYVDREFALTMRVHTAGGFTDYGANTAGGSASVEYWGVDYGADAITRAEFINGSGDAILYDEMTIGVTGAVVPEPMTAMLLVSGLLGVGAIAARRRDRLDS